MSKQNHNQTPAVQMVVTPAIQQNQQVVGYNRTQWLQRLDATKDSRLNLYHEESFAAYSPRKINQFNFNWWNNKSQHAQYIWDPIPELMKYPVSGYPDVTTTQYTLVNVTPPTPPSKTARTVNSMKSLATVIRTVFQVKPINQS
jgi:hypothetical protein